MAVIDLRQRSGILFLAVMLLHVVLISAQVNSKSGVPVLEAVTFGIFSEAQRSMSGVVSGVRRVWSGYIGLRYVKQENDALKRDLAAAQIAAQEQRALASRARGLEKLLELRDRTSLQTVAAEIIGTAPTQDFRTVTIDKGTREGLRPDMAVIAPAGVVGRIVVGGARAATEHLLGVGPTAAVQLLVDRNAAAGAIVERSRAQGVVVGVGGDRLEMEYVSEVYDLVVGDAVVTSGIDGIYPKGLIIGRIESMDRSGGAYKRIVVRPAVDFNALEEVLVVVTPTPARDTGGGGSE
jgi:rod shape-determining protein MreC